MLRPRTQSHMRLTSAQQTRQPRRPACRPQSSLGPKEKPQEPPAAAANSKANGPKRQEILQAAGVSISAVGLLLGGFSLDERIEIGQSLLLSRVDHLEMVVTKGFETVNGRIDATNGRIDAFLLQKAVQPAVAPPLSPAQPIVMK